MVAKLQLVLLILVLVCALVVSSGRALGDAARHAPVTRAKAKARPLHRHGHRRTALLHRRRRATPAPTFGVRVVGFARRMLGVPYVWGGDSPATGFDCSGLVRFVYGHFGLNLPHSSYADFDLGVPVSRRALRPGDLVFFNGLGHVGIYVGGDRFIQAPDSGSSVQITSLSAPWYTSAYDGARRIVGRGGHLIGRWA
jgi:cell wall-associated NlpC family hydrolase